MGTAVRSLTRELGPHCRDPAQGPSQSGPYGQLLIFSASFNSLVLPRKCTLARGAVACLPGGRPMSRGHASPAWSQKESLPTPFS